MTRFARASVAPPSKTLELYGFENDGESRLVREALCELELPYLLVNVGQGSTGGMTKLLVTTFPFPFAPLLPAFSYNRMIPPLR